MRIQTLNQGTPESSIPGFPMQLISRHVASINRMAQIYSGVSTMGNPELLSTGILIPRFLMSQFTRYGPLRVSPPGLDLLGPYDLPLYDRSHTTYWGFGVSNADKHFPTGLSIPQILILR
jgi:hypothetical protein